MPFVRPCPVLFRGVSMHRLWLVMLLLCRVGKASVPGPGSLPDPASVREGASVWQLAVCNPSGLGGKAFTCLDSPHDVVLLLRTRKNRQKLQVFDVFWRFSLIFPLSKKRPYEASRIVSTVFRTVSGPPKTQKNPSF